MNYHQQCRRYLLVCLLMFSVGMGLPIALALAAPQVLISPAVWNFLQIGGLLGAVVFGVLARLSRPKPVTATVASN